MDQKLYERVMQAIRERVFPGCVIGIVRANGEREIFSSGTFIYESAAEQVKEDTIYDVASVTKSIPTASARRFF